jgi:hypothetical protein
MASSSYSCYGCLLVLVTAATVFFTVSDAQVPGEYYYCSKTPYVGVQCNQIDVQTST